MRTALALLAHLAVGNNAISSFADIDDEYHHTQLLQAKVNTHGKATYGGNWPSYGGNWSEPSYGGNWSEPNYGNWSEPNYGNWSEPSYAGNWSEPKYGNWSEPNYGNWSEPSYASNWSEPGFGGNWSEPNYGNWSDGNWSSWPSYGNWSDGNWSSWPSYGNWSDGNWSSWPSHGNWSDGNWSSWPSYGNWSDGNWSSWPSHGNWSDGNWSSWPSHGGNWSEPSYGGNWSEPSYGGNWSKPTYGSNWSEPSYGGKGPEPTYGGTGPEPTYGSKPSYGGKPSFEPASGACTIAPGETCYLKEDNLWEPEDIPPYFDCLKGCCQDFDPSRIFDGMTCQMILDMGFTCDQDVPGHHIPEGTTVADVCPVTCVACSSEPSYAEPPSGACTVAPGEKCYLKEDNLWKPEDIPPYIACLTESGCCQDYDPSRIFDGISCSDILGMTGFTCDSPLDSMHHIPAGTLVRDMCCESC